MSDSNQNGATSRAMSLRPVRPHTHERFARYDGAMPQQTAITLADPAGTPAPSANVTRTAALSKVVPTETKRQRRSAARLTSERRREVPITKKRVVAATTM